MKNMKCAYCGCEGKMSREHIIPKGFINQMNWDNQVVYSEKSPIRVHHGEIMIKDVCPQCNNGELSKLDSYALNLIVSMNDILYPNISKVFFKYNYKLLLRWLLKVCYNSARSNDADFDTSELKKNIDFIMGRGAANSHIAVYGKLLGYKDLNKDKLFYHLDKNSPYNIDWFRVAQFRFKEDFIWDCVMRLIIINSIAFLVIVTDSEDTMKRVRNQLAEEDSKWGELSSKGKTCLKSDKTFLVKSVLSNLELKENYVKKRENTDQSLRIINLSRKDIENLNFDQITEIINSSMQNKDTLIDWYGKAVVYVDGYNEEKRELFQVKEYQNYWRKVLFEHPELIWVLWSDANEYNSSYGIIQACVNSNYIENPNDDSKEIKVDQEKVIELLKRFFNAINAITNRYAFDQSYNDKLTEFIFKVLN